MNRYDNFIKFLAAETAYLEGAGWKREDGSWESPDGGQYGQYTAVARQRKLDRREYRKVVYADGGRGDAIYLELGPEGMKLTR